MAPTTHVLNTSLKMPDAIVAATAVVRNSKLITADVKLLNWKSELGIERFARDDMA